MKRLLAVVLALGLAAAACGDSSEEQGADTTAAPGGDETSTSEAGTDEESGEGSGEAQEVAFDDGVTEDTIRVGLLAGLTGLFASLAAETVETWEVYFDAVNEAGGIAGRDVELVVLDQGYDVPRHIAQYEKMRVDGAEGVVMIGHSTGSPHTAAIAQQLADDDMIAHPFTFYSGWADPEFGANAAELYINYCLEAMNAVSFMHDKLTEEGTETKLAIISFPGEYGQDGATGAKLAAEALGIEVVYDGEAQVVPGSDQTPVISELVSSDPTLVFATLNPGTLTEVFGGARSQGLEAQWTGTWPTFNAQLLGTDLAPDLADYYTASSYFVAWGEDVPGMDALVQEMTERRPEMPVSDNYVLGWTQATLTHQLLEHAASRGDLTRAGVVEAFNDPQFVVDFGGLAPEQTWAGDPNEYLVRESYMYELSADGYDPLPLGEGTGSTGQTLLEGPFVSDAAEAYTWAGPCFAPQG